MADNTKIDIRCEGRENFEEAMKLIFQCASGGLATHYRFDNKYGIVLYWAESEKATRLPYSMNVNAAIEFVWNWLQVVDYGTQPNHDGSNTKGWTVFNENWSQIDHEWQAFAAIRPEWMMHGK